MEKRLQNKNSRAKSKPGPSGESALAALMALADPSKARFLAGFFKTGKGEYAEGDRFLGIPVPQIRQVARRFQGLPLKDAIELLKSPFNEVRLLALIVMNGQFAEGSEAAQEALFRAYLTHRNRVNNWNLVDASAPYILGGRLKDKDRAPLYELARSEGLWDRRIAIVATLAFIRANDFEDTLRLSELLLTDPRDLIHKACGWMLREAGKRDQARLREFLGKFQARMPRTMLRYAIEKFPSAERQLWLRGGAQRAP